MGYLYRLEFSSGKGYIGITERRTLSKRIDRHRDAVKSGGQYAVHRAWRKHGEPVVRVLAMASGKYLLDLEQRAIASYGTFGPGGYNMTPGGEVPPSTIPEIAAKLSVAMRGRKLPPETIARMRLFRPSAGTREKMAAAKRGRKLSVETRAKMSASQKARISAEPFSAEHRANISAALASSEVFKNRRHPKRDNVSGRYLSDAL